MKVSVYHIEYTLNNNPTEIWRANVVGSNSEDATEYLRLLLKKPIGVRVISHQCELHGITETVREFIAKPIVESLKAEFAQELMKNSGVHLEDEDDGEMHYEAPPITDADVEKMSMDWHCDECDKSFTTKSGLFLHKKRAHGYVPDKA